MSVLVERQHAMQMQSAVTQMAITRVRVNLVSLGTVGLVQVFVEF